MCITKYNTNYKCLARDSWITIKKKLIQIMESV